MKRPDPLTAAEEAEVDRLVARGRNRIAARQKVVEDRFRSRSQRREGSGGSRPVSDSLNSSHVNSVSHAPDTAGTWIPDAEEILQRTEEGLRRDD